MPLYQVNAGDRILAADVNQFYAILKGVAASGEAVTLVYNNQSLIFQPSSDPTAGTRVVVIKNNAGTTLGSWRYDALLELLSAAAAPVSPVAGSTYWDTAVRGLQVYTGSEWLNLSPGMTNRVPWYWLAGNNVRSTLTGTGTYAVLTAVSAVQLGTGATSGGTSGLDVYMGPLAGAGGGASTIRSVQGSISYGNIDANTNSWVYFTDESATAQPSNTARHLGLRQAGAVINFSTADNTTEQTTDVSAFVTAAAVTSFVIIFDGTTATLYLNGTLRATHATNVPGAAVAGCVFRAFIINSAAANKTLNVGRVTVLATLPF